MIKLFHLFDDDFQSQNAAKCDLLIHIGFETFQYAVVDIVRDELKSLAEYQIPPSAHNPKDLISAIEKLPEYHREFKFPFNKISLSFDTLSYTLIPESLYNEEIKEQYAGYFQSAVPGVILSNTIKSEKIRNIFSINKELYADMNRIFNKPHIYSQSCTFIEGIKKTYKELTINTLYIDIHEKHVQLALFNNSGLSFYNIFDCQNADELNYFILNTIETLQLLTEEISVMLSGRINSDDEYYNRVKKYFNKISFADSRLIVNHSPQFDGISSHTYFSLICLEQCE